MVERFESHSDQPTEARPLTQDEAALVSWLIAERDWHREVAAWQRNEERLAASRERDRQLRAARDAKNRKTLDEHARLVESASGFRRAALERHAPQPSSWWPHCPTCPGYDGDPESFPCDEYDFARDWRDSD